MKILRWVIALIFGIITLALPRRSISQQLLATARVLKPNDADYAWCLTMGGMCATSSPVGGAQIHVCNELVWFLPARALRLYLLHEEGHVVGELFPAPGVVAAIPELELAADAYAKQKMAGDFCWKDMLVINAVLKAMYTLLTLTPIADIKNIGIPEYRIAACK